MSGDTYNGTAPTDAASEEQVTEVKVARRARGGSDPGAEVSEAVKAAMASVIDPELGLDVLSMGLIYDVRVFPDTVEIDMTLTTPGCPVSEQLPMEVEDAARSVAGGRDVSLFIVWEPPWTPDRLTAEAYEKLGFSPR